MGRTYGHGGDIRSTIENMAIYTIPPLDDPADGYQDIVDVTGTVTELAWDQCSYMEK